MLSEKLVKALNDQLNYEIYSAYVYLAMESFFEAENWSGFAHFFKLQAEEEFAHARKFYDFLNQTGNKVKYTAINEPEDSYEGILDGFTKALHHEQEVTKRINDLADIALEEKSYAALKLLQWFAEEQVEEEDVFSTIITKLERINNNIAGLSILDKELGSRG